MLEQQFSKPSVDGLSKDGSSDFFNFSTGRRNVASLHTIFTLRPRHDLFQFLFQTGRTLVDLQYRPKDDIQLDFKLLPGAVPQDFVWAIVAKDELLSIKDSRWDLVSPLRRRMCISHRNLMFVDVRKDHRKPRSPCVTVSHVW